MKDAHTVIVPIRTQSEANLREHYRSTATRVAGHRKAACAVLRLNKWPPFAGPATVRLTRVAPSKLDTDNLASAMKAARDGVADAWGLDDAPGSGLTWEYAQRRGEVREYAVEITAWPTPEMSAAEVIAWLDASGAAVIRSREVTSVELVRDDIPRRYSAPTLTAAVISANRKK